MRPPSRARSAAIRTSEVQRLAKPWGPASAGARAFREGETPANCPHVLDTPLWHHWIAGWRAQYDRRFA